MVRRRLAAAVAVACATTVVGGLPANAVTCTMTEIVTGICVVGGGTDGSTVDLWINGNKPGGSSGGSNEIDCNETADGRCVGVSPPKDVDKPETIHDLESFRPERPGQFSEPASWTVAGLPTNFVSRAAIHVIRGELAGRAADVRFIPVRYRRSFGDGTSQSTTVRGARWSTPWSNTATSHTFVDAGTFPIELVVTYVADYRFSGLGWVRLAGTVTRSAPTITVSVFSADTVLVARSCSVGAIGCA